jgi:hypothetical protein
MLAPFSGVYIAPGRTTQLPFGFFLGDAWRSIELSPATRSIGPAGGSAAASALASAISARLVMTRLP